MAAGGRGAEAPATHAPIEDHGVIGDLHTAALVSTDGDIDWLCLPRFDSPSVFAALLDQDRGGRFSVRCAGATRTKQMYLTDSNILLTRFLGESSVGEVVDFMVPRERGGRGTLQLVRIVRAVRGAGGRGDPLRARLRLRPRPHRGRHRRGFRGLLLLLSGPAGPALHGAAGRRRRRGGGPPGPRRGRDAGAVSLAARLHQAARPRRGRRPADLDSGVLAAVAQAVPVPRPLPGDRGALRARAEAARPPAHGCARGGPHDLAAGVRGRHAELGLPVHVGARRRVHGLRPDAARLLRGGRCLHGLAGGPLHGDSTGTGPADPLQPGREPRPRRAGTGAPPGLPRLPAGPDRQRGG